MTRDQVILRVREKLAKLTFYHMEAEKLYGDAIAREMFSTDLDYLASILVLVGASKEEGH